MMGGGDGVCFLRAVLWFQHRQESETLYRLAAAIEDFVLTCLVLLCCQIEIKDKVLVSMLIVFRSVM